MYLVSSIQEGIICIVLSVTQEVICEIITCLKCEKHSYYPAHCYAFNKKMKLVSVHLKTLLNPLCLIYHCTQWMNYFY